MRSDVEEIKSRLNLVDVIGDYVRLARAGTGQWKGLCPFHKERTPSFTVSEERQLWHCFGCGKGGDLFSFVMEQEGMDFREALEMLAQRAGVTLRSAQGDAGVRADQKKTLFEILELATRFYQKQLTDGGGARVALPYLRARGINDASTVMFQLGFAPNGWRHVTDFLVRRGYALTDIAATGLIVQKDGAAGTRAQDYYDRFRGRIMFPITDPLGRVIGFSGRIVPAYEKARDGKSVAKYINTSASPVYHKSSVLYGIAQAKEAMKAAQTAVIVEGNMDVIAAHQAGVRNAVAVSGTALTVDHARIIRRYAQTVVLFFDRDAAGQAAARKSFVTCAAADLRVRYVVAPDGTKDAADLAAEDPAALRAMIDGARDAMAVFVAQSCAAHDVTQSDGRRAIVRDLAPLIAAHASAVEREYWAQHVAQRTQVAHHIIMEAVAQSAQEFAMSRRNASHEQRSAEVVATKARDVILMENLIALIALSPAAWNAFRAMTVSPVVRDRCTLLATLHSTAAATFDAALAALAPDDVAAVRAMARAAQTADTALVAQDDARAAATVRELCDHLHAAAVRAQRTMLAAQLAAAEARGDTAQRERILKDLQALG